MFQSARVKLTLWYLAILMLISGSFSAVIYKGLTREIDRFAQTQRNRIERQYRMNVLFLPDNGQPIPLPFPTIDDDALSEARHRIIVDLLIVNGAILFLAGGLGYILAGRTLQPIQDMVNEQNRFISDASHEFRTPLTALKSSMEVHLRDKKLTVTEAKKLITGSILEVNKLQSLSDSLLNLTQYEKTHTPPPMSRISLASVISEAVDQLKPLALTKHVTLSASIADCLVQGNAFSLHDLAVILIDNAIKYTPKKGKVRVSVATHDHKVLLTVTDTGMGIPAKDVPHIFERFYRADTARSKEIHNGYGLGLSIAKQIVAAHHGTITVESSVGKGSTFTVIFQKAS